VPLTVEDPLVVISRMCPWEDAPVVNPVSKVAVPAAGADSPTTTLR
jgi:hypothetical protein